MRTAAVPGIEAPRARRERARRRLLTAARQRYAEDRLAEAVSAGTRQVVVFGTALDTFTSHNPYRGVPVFRSGCTDVEIGQLAPAFDRDRPVFAVHLDGPGTAVDAILRLLHDCPGGAEIVFDVPSERATCVVGVLRDTGWAVLEELDPIALASRYLDLACVPADSIEPRLVWARVGNNAGRLPN